MWSITWLSLAVKKIAAFKSNGIAKSDKSATHHVLILRRTLKTDISHKERHSRELWRRETHMKTYNVSEWDQDSWSEVRFGLATHCDLDIRIRDLELIECDTSRPKGIDFGPFNAKLTISQLAFSRYGVYRQSCAQKPCWLPIHCLPQSYTANKCCIFSLMHFVSCFRH